jgi:pimeloyl-ACP methyl ester carboxylesterase
MTIEMQTDIQGEGPPIVLVGGGLTGWLSWEPHRARLVSTRRVVRAQPLSVQYGLETRPLPAGYGVKMESGALATALGKRDLGPVDLVAWSYGAEIALDYALDHPDRIRTLTLIEPPAFWVLDTTGRLDETSRKESDELRRFYLDLTGDVSEDQLERFLCQVGLCPPGQSVRDLPQWPVWVKHRRSLLNGEAPWAHRDDAARLRGFARPVLLVKGTGSAHFLHAISDALAATLPRAETVELPGGHAPNVVSMDEFLRRLAAFQAAAGAR